MQRNNTNNIYQQEQQQQQQQLQQQHQQQHQQMQQHHSEMQKSYNKQEFHSMQQQQQRITSNQQFVQKSHVTTQQRVEQHGSFDGGYVQQQHQSAITQHVYGQPDGSPPVFEQIFKNARFAQGGNALFEGKLRGNPKPFVSWTRKGAPLLESQKFRMNYNEATGEVSLLINQIGPGDEGEYTCTARNQFGEAICSVYIQPEGAPMPTLRPVQKIEQKSSYTNGCTYSSVKEEFRVDTFEYRLLREVSFREAITRRSNYEQDSFLSEEVERSLGPAHAPQIGQKPRNSKLVEGSDAVFSAKVGSNPKPRMTWFHNGQRLVSSNKYETSYSSGIASLRVKNANINDAGHYTLLAENTQGCVVASAVLAVEPAAETQHEPRPVDSFTTELETGKALPPVFVQGFANREITEGRMTRFDCRVTGNPYPEVIWLINGIPVKDDASHKILVNEAGSHSLMIINVGRQDAGAVQCLARNKAGEVAIEAQLNVLEKEQVVAPQFVQRFSTMTVRQGEPITMSANAIGTPMPRITWQKDGVQISSTAERYIGIDGGMTCLEIPHVKPSDAGWYQCTAQNVAGSTANRARLYVEVPKEPTATEQRRLNLPRPTKVIEPEPEPEPEIIYLRHVERAKPHLRPGEEERIYPPPQFIVPLQNVQHVEGGRVHFEARIDPVGDPTMVVEWYLNGRPLAASSRATSVFKFGFIALDLLSIVVQDAGEYMCRVTNAAGMAESRAILSVVQRPSIEKTPQNPQSLQYINQLEDYSRYQRQESSEELMNQKPVFIVPLRDLGAFEEGKNAHFEAQVNPVNDPTMRVEWYKDGRPITASSRITAIFNFGYVSLNIMHLRAEDTGSYTVRAVNRVGEAISTSTIRVNTSAQVTADLGIQEQQRYIESVEQLEEHRKGSLSRQKQEAPEPIAPPHFKTQIQHQLNLSEGGYAHFEARLEPIGESTMRVEWLKDGQVLEASSRTTSFFNFGYVALTIKQLTVHDAGTYTCRAYNAMGQDTTTANLTVLSKSDILFESQHPGGLEKIQHLENSALYTRTQEQEEVITQMPRFLGPMKGTNKILEGQRAHFETRVEPQSDLGMKVEWYHNGQPLLAANRIKTYYDFGYVALDISQVRAEDAGVYTVVARNKLGEAQCQGTMVVETRSSIDTSSMHRGLYERTQVLEEKRFTEPQYSIDEISKSKPVFVQPLSDQKPIAEGKNVHLECRLEPMGDPTMRVEWFHNGRPITVGSRFRTYNDFGFVALDIVKATANDSGEYTVRATNHLGSDHTSSFVRVIDHSDVDTETQNGMSLEQIQMLEDSSRRQHHMEEDITIMQAPQFTRPLRNVDTTEGVNVHLECRLQPVGDPTMRVEWFVNGVPVKTGHRFRPAYEFDYVALDLLGCYAADSGVYTCQARNQLGEALTSCSVRIAPKNDLILETQNESGLQKIAYLEDSSRYRRSEFVDEVVNTRPRFLTHPKSMLNVPEGGQVHFECKIEPVTDSHLKVEWFKDGRPITVGHRFRPVHDFGYVALVIVDCIAEDSGIYTCRATNLLGFDETRVELQCRVSDQIVTVTQNEAGLEKIHYLEDRTRYSRREEVDETTKQAPVFTTSLKNIEIKENQRAHFECRLIPVSDPTLRVEWFHNNEPLKSGSRFTETNNFGFVALDIMSCLPEDAGTYTCHAYNAVGEAITSAVAIVHTKKAIYRESQHENALPRLKHLEDSSKRQRMSVTEEVITQAPMFTLPVRDRTVAEGQAVHFEARLIPVGDPNLKVEWLRNGQQIEASNRITTMNDFGYVALNMKYVNPEDSGTYTCRAVNELGQAVTSSTLIVKSKTSIQMETQHEAAMHKIHQLEDHTKYQRREEEEYVVTQAPRFVTKLMGPSKVIEGKSAHYECRIEPYPDPHLKVEWLHNGKPLGTGHRFRTTYDFGFAALDILTVYAEDSGEYTCLVTNKLGEARSSINLEVTTRSSIIQETQHEAALETIHYLESGSRYQRKVEEEEFLAERPQFGRPLRNANVNEGTPVHLEATLTPVNDPTIKVEWFCNGLPIQTGHRFKTTYDFGFVALDILYAHAEDTGTYMCRAKNAVGEAVTTCAVNVTANKTLDLDTMDEQRLEKIRQLETYAPPVKPVVEEKGEKPQFLTPLANMEHLKEGEHAHLECRVKPVNDANLKIEWFCNGKQLPLGHRFRTTHDFGYVALDILYVYGEDTGTYMCKATNLLGEAVNTCNVRVLNRRSMILDTQHPDALEKIQKLESKAAPSRTEISDAPISAPHFTAELRGTTEIYEGQSAHFEAQVQPVHDPNLRIEFYHNGKPLPSASRFHITFDFGYVSLDISHAVAEDAGEYSVRAVNSLGQAVSATNLRVIVKSTIISDSQHPEGLKKIEKLESNVPFQRPEIESPATRQRPVFTQPLQNIDRIKEHQNAHFECHLIPVGDPNLKVEWYRNEKLIEDSSRITKQHEFGFVALDIQHIRKEDEGVYMCRAVNPLGEAVTTASMRVVSEASIQMDTQHPDSVNRIRQLERGAEPRAPEPERIFDKPIFTQLLTGPSELWEGQHAHFEARVVPVGDPTLKFEWFINGVELQMGSRLHTQHDFGFVTLDINSVTAEDSGVYMCRAYNESGEAISSTAMKVKTKSNIDGSPLVPESWEAIQQKEAAMNRVPQMFVDSTPQQAPVFTTHLQSFDKLSEGQHVLLEAQVEPRADPNLRIEWFKNGITLTTGARIRSTFDFGLVTLSINGLRADDSAIYTCKATNQVGEAVSTCSLKIEDHHWLHGESLHPQSLPRIGELEAPKPGRPEAPEITYETPVFISHLNNIECKEGDNVRFECNVEPARDPTMQVEWYYNGQVLQAASKVKTIYDFGFCALDLSNTYAENSGVYTCKATNSKGTASTSGTLKCLSGKTMFLDTQHPQGTAGLEQIQETEEALANRYNRQVSKPETQFPAPVWTRPLQPEFHLGEAQPLHLEANVEPKEDPNLYIEWYFNGKLLQHGSRFKMTSEFGFVTMDVIEIYERDQGIYTCKAYNRAGEAFTTTTVYCSSKESIIERTQHPKGAEGLEQIQDLEESLRRTDKKPEKPEDGMAPQFVTQFTNIADIGEGEIAHYEATLIPTGDQSMVIEWFYNGKILEASHRVRTIYAFGMVALEILGTKVEDSGTYVCRATNKYGSAECTCTLECVEKPYGQKPHFTSHIQPLEGLKDGQSAHFECTLIPVNDPELKVEWYHNGKLLRHSNRIKTVSDFGYVVLDIAYLQDHDSGEYVCRAFNKYGEDFTRTTLNCRGRGGVFYDTLQPDSLNRIRELECPQPGQADTSGPVVTEPPKFITHIRDVSKLVEGQSAHFEAHLTPVTDPDLKVEWFFNGKKLPHGHRFRTFHDFGIVILDILYCYEENSGVYECRATNKYGSDVTTAKLQCSSKTNLILDSQLPRGMEGGLEKIANLEYSMVRTRDETTEETKGKAPVFTVPLENIEQLREGENAHFEARVTPTDDPRLKVEWYWNGRPLKAGSRFRTFCEFGFVILEISPVYPEDSGEYSCRAINEYGEAVTTATMKIQGKRSIIMESQLPKGMEGTIDRIAQLEGLGARSTEFVEDIDTGKPPEFITSPFDMEITENSLAHFECRLQPINDPSMRVDWFHNGKALWAGSRIKTINDFGFVILEIAGCYQRDSGLYTCKATNKHGEATVSCKLHVKGRQGIIMEPQLPNNFRTGTESLQKLEESIHKREEIVADEEQPSPPKFTEDIKDNLDVPEGGPIHFDCRVEPVGDPTMRIDWFHNGRPMPTGSRVHQLNDFGFIALDIDYIYTRDSGEYTCRATNKWGTATTKAKVTCRGKQNIIYDSQLPDGISAEKLKELEKGRIPDAPKIEDVEFGPPKFVTEISSVIAEEAEAVRFECQVEPKNDPNLRVEWFRNGKLLPSGHRYRNIFDMGFVSLDILYVYAEDSGEYVCRAYNKYGEAFTRAKVSCKQLPTIILQNQVPRGMKRSEALTQMEATIKKYTSEVHLTEDDLFDPDRKQPPRFVTQIKEQLELTEMSVTKFECQLAPVGDPNMKVEWYFNGKPLLYKNRFQPIYDFGYVAMNFGWVYPEDSGEYVCVATNLYGRDETRAVIKVSGKPGIVYDSQLPAHMQSIDRIREMEASWQVVPEEADPDAKPRSKPTFVSKLEPQTVEEGEPARFCVRVTGHPRPRVMWLINGHTVVHGSRYKLTNDGMFHLDIPKTRQYDTGKVEVIARNSVGEAIASTQLKVVARSDDYRSVLKNSPRPWYDYELASYQKERQETELEKVFDDRKQYLAEQSTPLKGVEHLKPKQIKTEAPEWQQTVLAKKSDDYYSKLQELETEQLLKETKLREDTHQIALPASKVELVSSKRGSLKTTALTENTEETSAVNSKTQVKKTGVVEPAESSVHAREVYMNKQLQTQKERQGDMEITRKITATETTEMEHKGTVQERVVKGPVQPAKPPVFTKKIQPCRVFENEQAKFEVEFDGEPMPTVKWYRETFPIQNSPDLQIHTFSGKSVLIIRQVFVEDSAVFSCIAENRGGTAKCSANLVVEERRRAGKGGVSPPSFVTTIQSAAVVTGQLARFDAKVTGSKPMDVYWLKNGKKVQPSIKFKMLEEDNVYTLLIIEPLPEDSGHYECVAVNVAGEARCDADCVVQSPSKPEKPAAPGSEKAPHIVEQLKSQSVEEGSKVIFKCRIEGKPTPTARWMRGENIVKPSRYFQMSRQSDNYQLVISEAFPEDEGMYKCIAENKLGSVQTSAQLKVRPMENLEQIHITALKNVSVTEGMPAQFKTVITGKAKPTSVQWFREGALIPETPDFQMIFDGNAAVLLIGTTYEEDSGVFTVRVTSSSGQVESSAKLTVKKRRISAYQLGTIDSAGDDSSSSGKEESSPESPQPQLDGQQPGQFLQVNGQVQHQGRSTTKKTKKRSRSLQPLSNLLPWRKSTRPRRGRSLEKSPFLPGFKPEPLKSWTEEPIQLKHAIIEKKVIPKLEAAKVVLKSIKSERDHGLMSIGATLEQIIKGKTEKEAIPWITMREKLKHVEMVQKQLEKFSLDEVYLRPLEKPIITEGQQPQQVALEQERRDKEIQRLKSMESIEIMEMTDQINKLLMQQHKEQDTIPWKEMRQHLKKVQTVHKKIEKFKLEEVELRALQAAEETLLSSMEHGTDVIDAPRQQFIMTEDISIMHVSEKEKLEMQRILREQQEAVNWRQQHGQKRVDMQSSRQLDRQISTEQSMQWNKQQFVTAEDTQISHLQSYEHEQMTQRMQNEQAKHWRTQRQKQQVEEEQKLTRRLQEEEETLQKPQPELKLRTQEQTVTTLEKQIGKKSYEEMIDLLPEEAKTTPAEEKPVMWQRGKKTKQRTDKLLQSTEVEQEVAQKSYEEMVDVLPEETKKEEVVEEQAVMWERGKKQKKTVAQTIKKSYEETVDVLPEETKKEEVVEEQPVLWQRGKKQKKTVESQETMPSKSYEETVDVLPEETKKEEVVEEQPVMWQRGKKQKKTVESQETMPAKSYEETVDVLPEETKKEEVVEEQPVMWQRGKKQKKTVEKSEETIPAKTYEETVDVLPEETKKEEVVEEQAVMWERGKKQKKTGKEQPLKPVEVTEENVPTKSFEKLVDVLPEEIQKEEVVEEQPVLWQRGKKQKPKAKEEVIPSETTVIEHPTKDVEEVKPKHRSKQIPKEPEQPRETVQLKPVPRKKSEEKPKQVEKEESLEELKPIESVVEEIEEEQQPLDNVTKREKKHKKRKSHKDKPQTVEEDTKEVAVIPSEEEEEIKPYEITTEETYAVATKEEQPEEIKPVDIVEEVKPRKPATRKQLPKPAEPTKEEVTLKPVRKSQQVEEEVPKIETKEIVETRVYDDVVKTKTKKKKPKAVTEAPSEDVADLEEEGSEVIEQPQEVKSVQPIPVVEQVEEVPEVGQPEESMPEKKVAPLPVEEKLEDVKLKTPRKISKPLPQEAQIEEVKLKTAKRPVSVPEAIPTEEVALKHVETPADEFKQEEKKKPKKVRKPKQEDLPEIPDAERLEHEQPEHIEIEKEVQPHVPEDTKPYQREKKKPLAEEVIEEKQWPTGKRRPLPEEVPEEVKLKPIPAKPKETTEQPIPAADIPKPKYEDKVVPEEKELEISPPEVEEEKEKVKKEKKKKPKTKLLKATPSIEVQDEEEIAEPFVEPITEEEQVEEVPIESVLEATVAVSEQVLLEEEVVPTEEKLASKQKAQKKRTKRLKDVSFEDQPELLEATVVEKDDVVELQEEEETEEVSKKSIQLKKTEDQRPQFITTEQLIELDVEDVRRDLGMKLSSNIVKKEKRTVLIDDSQPLPELELITQKRVSEDVQVEEETPEAVIEETKEEETRKVTKKKKKTIKPPRITEKLSPRLCVEEQPTVLECKVEGQPFPEINWYFNDSLLFASEKYELNVIDDVAQLKIAKVTPNEIGLYTCEAKNEAGLAKTTTNIALDKEDGIAPIFTEPVNLELIDVEDKVRFTCQVTGKPQPLVKFYYGVEEIIPDESVQFLYDQQTGDVVLEMLKPMLSEASLISVEAQNTYGRAVTNVNVTGLLEPKKLPVEEAPRVTPLQPQIIPHGGTLVLESKFSGLPKPQIKWLRNGREIETNEDTTIEEINDITKIKIINMTRKRTGKYEVCAVNKIGEAKSSGSVVVTDQPQEKGIQAPRFIQPLWPKCFVNNEVAILEVEVASEPLSSFQWFLNAENIKSSKECRITSVGNKSTLVIENFTKEVSGPYTCRAENVGGSVTSTATFSLLDEMPQQALPELQAPKFIEVLPEYLTIMDAESLTLNCRVIGTPTPKVKWYYNDLLFEENRETLITRNADGVCQLQITEVFPDNTGVYKCVATNSVGETETLSCVNVQVFEYIPDSEITGLTSEDDLDRTLSIDERPPIIVKKLPEQIVQKEGDLAKLEVQVFGKPKPKVKWLRDNVEIFASEEYQIETFEDGRSLLVINYIYPDDHGTISFEAHNPLGVATTTALLTVEEGIVGSKDYRKPEWVTHMEQMQKALKAAKCSPSLVNELRDCRAAEGENAIFNIQFAGNPKPDILWYFNNKVLSESEKYKFVVEESTASLEILNISYDDVGFYSCKLTNEIGMTTSRAKFDISTTTTTKTTTTAQDIIEIIEKPMAMKKKLKKSNVAAKQTAKSHKTEVTLTPAPVPQTTMNIVKVRTPVSVLVEKSGVSEVMEVKDRKEVEKEEIIIKSKQRTEEETIKFTKQRISEMRTKISQKSVKIEDMLELKQHREVNELLEEINASSFGSIGESALRDLATIGLLLRYECTVVEIVYLYEQNIFISLKKPECQSALVQLVEREGHETLITEILSESSTEDETILAATVGFKAFIRMIQTREITIETVIRKFVREDFITQDWKISSKERTIESSQLVESHQAVTHIKIEETFVEERTVIVEEGLHIDTEQF